MKTELRKQIARFAVSVADESLDYEEARQCMEDAVRHAAIGNEYHRLLDEALYHFDWALREVRIAAGRPHAPEADDDEGAAGFYLQPVLEELGYIVD